MQVIHLFPIWNQGITLQIQTSLPKEKTLAHTKKHKEHNSNKENQ
jgi:hypothetical protein